VSDEHEEMLNGFVHEVTTLVRREIDARRAFAHAWVLQEARKLADLADPRIPDWFVEHTAETVLHELIPDYPAPALPAFDEAWRAHTKH
jgi:hypothetical protein